MAQKQEFGPAIDFEFSVEGGLVGIDGRIGEMELAGNLTQGQPFRQKSRDLLLALGEKVIGEESIERGKIAYLLPTEIVQPFLSAQAKGKEGQGGEEEKGDCDEDDGPISTAHPRNEREKDGEKKSDGIGEGREDGPAVIEEEVSVFFGVDTKDVIERKEGEHMSGGKKNDERKKNCLIRNEEKQKSGRSGKPKGKIKPIREQEMAAFEEIEA